MGKGKNATLGEVMGKAGAAAAEQGVELHHLPDLLGEGMPKLEYHALGRLRLMAALKQRFGENFRNVPGISHVIGKFDEEAKKELQYHLLKKRWSK